VSEVGVTERFARLVAAAHGPGFRLDEACLLVAAHADPGLDPDEGLAELDAIAAGCRTPTLDGLRAHLYEDLGFRGNRTHYYDPRNSLLHEVLRRRTGIPITLAVVTMEVGRRVGVPLAGVGMPGHFLLRDQVDRTVFVDPFDGRELDAQGCRARYEAIHDADAAFDPAYLEPVEATAIVRRVLTNLALVYNRERDRPALTWVLRLLALLPEATVQDHTRVARMLTASGAFGEAAAHFERMAEMSDDADEAQKARTRATRLRARLN